jgi:hypothetical protein
VAPTSKRFKTTVQSWGNSCGIELPFNPKDAFGKVRVPVNATIGRHTYRTTTCAMHGSFWIPLNKANREAAGVEGGQTVSVTLALDDKPRTVPPPQDLVAAMRKAKGAKAAWDALSFTHQREHVEAIESAKRPETRARRIARAIEMLTARA